MYRFFLSLRYLRARRTNWIGVAGIFVGVTALILILSIMSGFLNESRKHLRGNLSDIIVAPEMSRPLMTGELPARDPTRLLEIVRSDPRVESACLELVWYGMLTVEHKGDRLGSKQYGDIALVSMVGIDVEDEFRTTDLRASLENELKYSVERPEDFDDPFAKPSRYNPPGRVWKSAILGEQLAAAWRLHRADEFELVTTSVDPETGAVREASNRTFVCAGTFRSGENEMDLERVYIDRRELADFLGEKYDWNNVLIKLRDYDADAEDVVRDLRAQLFEAGYTHDPGTLTGSREVQTWEAFRGSLLGAIENEKTLMGIMLSLVMVVAGFTVFAILSMMVTEKRRDVGILCALGATRKGILVLFLMMGFWEVLIGATLGTAAGIWSALKIDPIERWLSSTFGIQIFDRTVYIFDHIPSVIEVFGVVLIVTGAIVSTLLFAAIPAWRAANLDPIDALRYE